MTVDFGGLTATPIGGSVARLTMTAIGVGGAGATLTTPAGKGLEGSAVPALGAVEEGKAAMRGIVFAVLWRVRRTRDAIGAPAIVGAPTLAGASLRVAALDAG